MRRATSAASVIVVLILASGCSGPDADTAATAPAPVTQQTSGPEPFEGMSNAEVLTPILTAVKRASSVHIITWTYDGTKKAPESDLRVNRSGKGYGTVVIDGSTVSFRRLGQVLYMKADRRFWSDFDQASRMANRWIKVRKGLMKETDAYLDMLRPADWAEPLAAADPEDIGLMQRHNGMRIDGVEATALLDGPQGVVTTGGLFFPSSGPSYPLEYRVGVPYRTVMRFQGWNTTTVHVVAPPDPLDLTTLS